MSRYEMLNKSLTLVVGWDKGLQTFFGRLTDNDMPAGEEEILWVGTAPKELRTVIALQEALKHYWSLGLDERTCTQLCQDRDAQGPLTPHQQHTLDWLSAGAQAGNVNCLEGMRCPNPACQSEGPFDIVGTAWFESVTDDGTDTYHDVEWDDTNACTCRTCDHRGTVGTFRGQPPQPQPMPLLYWVITHEHRHGMSQTIFTHPTKPDMEVIRAYAKRVLDYEEHNEEHGEFLTLERCDPFVTYAEIEAEAKRLEEEERHDDDE